MSAPFLFAPALRRHVAKPLHSYIRLHDSVRHITGVTNTTGATAAGTAPSPVAIPSRTALSRLPWLQLVRSMALTTLMCSPTLLKPSIAAMGLITHPKVSFLDPESNTVLNRLIRWVVYDQFCAGANKTEVAKSLGDFKSLGYQGVILTFAKEIVLDEKQRDSAVSEATGDYSQSCYDMVESWKQSSLDSLRMIEAGDVLAMKVTGAGPIAVDALQSMKPMPKVIDDALTELCAEAKKQGSRVWFDAEQQSVQHGIDEWAIELMRRWNADGQALVYNTIQAYLKAAEANADRHIAAAAKEGWKLGLKLVRGAYIEHEERGLIHDTKEDTDNCYDSISDKLINQKLPEDVAAAGYEFPAANLMLATHNAESTAKACQAHKLRVVSDQTTCGLECAQVAGMADELGCELIMNYENTLADQAAANAIVPKPYKCLTWGSVGECMGYLHRRAIENKGAVERTKHMAAALRKEFMHRLTPKFY